MDAMRARDAARRLSDLKPDHKKSYERQLKETLEKIEAEAEQIRREAA
jgi:ABC-type Zn uptake system ZnuABC Zn-binding protein ZnuA